MKTTMKKDKILVIGPDGNFGAELIIALKKKFGAVNVFAAGTHLNSEGHDSYIQLDVLDHSVLKKTVKEYGITQIYLLSAMHSVSDDMNAFWKANMQSLLSVLEVAKDEQLDKVFWPSSIAVFGPGSPRYNCPQTTYFEPNTIYGISKRTGEHWCNYYHEKYGVDVRSLRYPGLISYSMTPGEEITDYAAHLFHQALDKRRYTCFLDEDTCLPMTYMPDAVRATIELMDAAKEKLSIRTSYNFAGMSFSPCDLVASIRKHIPEFKISYSPDYRQAIARDLPASLKDEHARKDWDWKPDYNLKKMVDDMIQNLRIIKGISVPESIPVLEAYPDFPIDDYVFTKFH